MLLTAGLLIVCLSGDVKQPDVAGDDEPRDPLKPVTRKAAPAKKAATVKPLIVLTREDEAKVQEATRKGVDYLKKTQVQFGIFKGSWKNQQLSGLEMGFTALAGLTLLESEVPPADESVQNAAQFIRDRINIYGDPQISGLETYEVSLAELFLCRLDDPRDRALIRSLALRLVASQLPSGGWSYGCGVFHDTKQESDVLALLANWPATAKRPIPSTLAKLPLGAFRHAARSDEEEFVRGERDEADNSNTQFAVLALWAARRYDLPIDPALQLVARRFRATQQPDGSWFYMNNGRTVSDMPTMTAAGLLGLAVGFGLETETKGGGALADKPPVAPNDDRIVKKALVHLAKKVGNPGQNVTNPPEMYFLWSVERVAVLYHQVSIEGKDWYHWGLEILLANQKKDGRWFLERGQGAFDLVDTCFALLFLQRANLVKDLTDKIQMLIAALEQPQGKE